MKSASVNVPRQREQPSAPPSPPVKTGGALIPLQSHFGGALAGLEKMVQK